MKSAAYFTILLLLLSVSCRQSYTPRPYGYYRVTIPAHAYKPVQHQALPYRFDISQLSEATPHPMQGENYWLDIRYPSLKADIHCSYKTITGNLAQLSEDARRFVYAHSDRADNIAEHLFEHPERRVYGILYDLKGNVASPVQFVITDSTRHFFRGALYFETVPNKDSIAPMLEYVREDIVHLMESFEWTAEPGIATTKQETAETPVDMLTAFYTQYITETSNPHWNQSKRDSIIRTYCTERITRIVHTGNPDVLDYDLFLNAQDCDINWLNTLAIVPETAGSAYRISYEYTDYKGDIITNTIRLQVTKENDRYKISKALDFDENRFDAYEKSIPPDTLR